MTFPSSKPGAPFKPKIACPISSPDEVEMLAANGADEFYCGIAPPEWLSRYGAVVGLNRRVVGRANVSHFSQLRRTIEKARTHSIPVFLTLNAPCYAEKQMPYLIDLARRCRDAGAAGLIVSDVGLILALQESRVQLDILLSSVAAVYNSRAAVFFRGLGVKRIILSRHRSLAEIEEIKEKTEGLEYEVFILNDGCVYEEGFCSTTHTAGPFCTTDWRYELYEADGARPNDEAMNRLGANLEDYKKWIWYANNCGCSFSEKGLPNGPCGLCAVHDFHRMEIDSLKIVGREASPYRKLRSLQMVRAVVEKVKQGLAKDEIRRYAMELRGTREYCDSGYMCYYRSVGETTRERMPSASYGAAEKTLTFSSPRGNLPLNSHTGSGVIEESDE